jgi:hypothetical protein
MILVERIRSGDLLKAALLRRQTLRERYRYWFGDRTPDRSVVALGEISTSGILTMYHWH